MGLFDRSAFPDHLDTQEEVDNAFPDDSDFIGHWWGRIWKWQNKKTKHWSAFGPRSPIGVALMPLPWMLLIWLAGWPIYHWQWTWLNLIPVLPVLRKWRDKPFVLVAVCGRGSWRLEKLSGGVASAPERFFFFDALPGEYYLSRIQTWSRWHVALIWPLGLQWHFYPNAKDVLGTGLNKDVDGKLWGFYGPEHFDGDWIHWYPSAFFGRNPK